ncbi:MAG TPA: amidohydrolase family protein [Streptosporangiaceae bacterium]|nr:amidohydrolase family protein [Streptosporangiaceae bacterium]
MPDLDATGLWPAVADLGLADHHCHGVVRRDLDRPAFEAMLTEAGYAGAGGVTMFGSQLGLALRRWCPPVLGLDPHAGPDEYLAARAGLGHEEVGRRFLLAAGLDVLYVDTGFEPEPLTSPAELATLAGAASREVVRLEQVAETVGARLAGGAGAGREFGAAFRAELATRAREAIGLKSVAAYRVGLDLAPDRPTETEVAVAAAHWLDSPAGTPGRLADPVLHRFFIWCGADLGLPIQFHVGYGDRDVDLHRGNPLLLTGLLRALEPAGVPVMLLHNYPFHREAGYLAQVFRHVYVDAGLATHNLGRGSAALIAETLELTPFGKFLYSSDGFGLPELHYLGALLFRRGLSAFLRAGLDDGSWTRADAEQIARQAGYRNARRVYEKAAG